MRVDLVYDIDCPNVAEARAELVRAFVSAGVAPMWNEQCRSERTPPDDLDVFGSPTILVDGRDVAMAPYSGGRTCRVYDGGRRAPPRETILAALTAAGAALAASSSSLPAVLAPEPAKERPAWLRVAAAAPGLGVALLPKVACPACWPLYAGVLGSVGLGFLARTEILLPLTIVFLASTLVSLAIGAQRRRGYRPLAAGAVASLGLLIGKFVFDIELAVHACVVLLIASSLWNAWPRRSAPPRCSACVSSTPSTEGVSA